MFTLSLLYLEFKDKQIELKKIKSNIGEEKLVQYRNFVEKMDT